MHPQSHDTVLTLLSLRLTLVLGSSIHLCHSPLQGSTSNYLLYIGSQEVTLNSKTSRNPPFLPGLPHFLGPWLHQLEYIFCCGGNVGIAE